MKGENKDQLKRTVRSPDFRYIPCDSINLSISENGIKIIFGIEEVDGTTFELVGIQMPHKLAAYLSGAINKSITHFTKETGIKLDFPEFDLDPIEIKR